MNVAAVRGFALDVVADLKQTRMLGVAIGLGVALLAITVVVLRPGGPPSVSTGYAQAEAAPPGEVTFSVPGEKPMRISELELERPRDPFMTLQALDTAGSAPAPAADGAAQVAGGGSGGGGGGGASGGGGSPTPVSLDDTEELVPLDDLSGGSERGSDGGSGKAVAPEPKRDSGGGTRAEAPSEPKPKAPPTDYAYVVDVQFGVEGVSLKRYRSVQRLGFVPSRKNPLLMYLGVKADKQTAVFMVDSRLSQGGEGECVPKPSQCTFIEMSEDSAQDEHRFRDAEGNEYLLRLREIIRTTARSGSIGGPDAPTLPGSPELVDGSR